MEFLGVVVVCSDVVVVDGTVVVVNTGRSSLTSLPLLDGNDVSELVTGANKAKFLASTIATKARNITLGNISSRTLLKVVSS